MVNVPVSKVFNPPEGKRYARIPCDFSARCKAVGLNLYERAVLMSLMCYQLDGGGGQVVLISGTDRQISADTGIAPGNVRKALGSLRKKGVIDTTGVRKHILRLDLWGLGEAASVGMRREAKADGASSGKQEAHPHRCSFASREMRDSISEDAHKEGREQNSSNISAEATLLEP